MILVHLIGQDYREFNALISPPPPTGHHSNILQHNCVYSKSQTALPTQVLPTRPRKSYSKAVTSPDLTGTYTVYCFQYIVILKAIHTSTTLSYPTPLLSPPPLSSLISPLLNPPLSSLISPLLNPPLSSLLSPLSSPLPLISSLLSPPPLSSPSLLPLSPPPSLFSSPPSSGPEAK